MSIGTIAWREQMSSDVAKSIGFYGELFGWKSQTVDMPTGPYTLFSVGEKQIAGLMAIPPGAGFPSHWVSYVEVADPDATAARITAKGGTILMPPTDVPMAGRIAMAMDPQGGAIAFMKPEQAQGPRTAPPGVGEFCWEQLQTTDVDAAVAFYTDAFGWTTHAFPGGPMQVFKAGDVDVASIMAAPPGVPAHWIDYVVVPDLADARARAERLGGKVMVEAIPVPNIGTFAVVQDPVGAYICPFEAPR